MHLGSKNSESDTCMENQDVIVEKSQLESENISCDEKVAVSSSLDKEIAIVGFECDMLECVNADAENGKESVSMDLNLLDSGLKEDIYLLPDKLGMESDSAVDEFGVVKVLNDNEDKKTLSAILDNIHGADKKVKVEDMIVFDDGSNVVDENGEGVLGSKNRKRGRKRKVLESNECNGDMRPIVRVLRSNTVVTSDSVKVDGGRLNESVVGFKRQMEAECLDQTELQKQVNEKRKMAGRPQKKQKRRGRPPKIQSEAGSKVRIKAECFDKIDLQNEVKSTSLTGRQQKKQKTVGRPPKLHSEKQGLKKNKHKNLVNLKRPGRPSKMKEGIFSTHLTNAKRETLLVVKRKNKQLKDEDVKESSKLHNVPFEDALSEIITVDSKLTVKASEDSNVQTTAEEAVNIHNTKKVKNSIGGVDRRKEQQLVRDQIVNMIMKAGWKIEYRKRLQREYLDAVYVDEDGKTHWSVTKAYFCLKKKIEKGNASMKEVATFTPIPDEEMSLLFRSVSKVRSDKNQKKKKIGKKNARKAEIIINGEAELERHKKKPVKKGKCKKKKETRGPKVTQKSRQSRKPRLIARSTCQGSDQDNDNCTLYSGKRNLLSWMIDSGVITMGGSLQYGEGRNGLLEGVITHEGIHCRCCNEIIDIASFVAHGEGSRFTEGLGNIYLQSGLSLVKCLLQSWRKEESSRIRFNHVDIDVQGEDPSDDTCNMCGDGGDLICCDGCPSTFHQSCLGIQNFPSGDWRCTYCSCKFCGLVAGGASEMDGSHHAPTSEMSKCCLCEEKFHHLCLEEKDALEVDSSSLLFCGRQCHEIHDELQTYLGVEFELEDGYTWTLLKRSEVSQTFSLDDQRKVECNSKLAVAFSIMDECFEPIMDERSGTNMIQNVVYSCGSNFRRLNYSGFYTALLERGGEMISVASIRIHGHRLAEMPFIATRNMYRRQGMCRRLLDAIENALSSLDVRELVIPAIPELYITWTNVFGFKPLEESKREALRCMSIIVFPGTDMLRKPLLKNHFAKKNVTLVAENKTLGCIAVVNDENAIHLETKSSNAIDSASVEEVTHLESADLIKSSLLTSKDVPKNTFDLNLQPAATDSDIQPIDDGSISREAQVCKNSFELSDSRAQVDLNATQPLVLV